MRTSIFKKLALILAMLLSCSLGMLYYLLNNQWVDFSALERYNPGRATILLDDRGVEWARFQLDKRDPILFEQISQHLINAFVAAEDWSFFTHQGISFRGIARSILVNIYHGGRVQGASTITQQLVKLLFLDSDKTFTRKIKEQCFAVLTERNFTKQHILQTYLNHVYFGCGIYGVQAACQRFWGINIADISIDQAAVLASIVRSPARYCPITCPLSAQKRRDVVLGQMRKLNFITPEEHAAAIARTVTTLRPDTDPVAPHLRETIRVQLEKLLGKENLYTKGYTVQTTLNCASQKEAQKLFNEQVKKLKTELDPTIDGALITMDAKTGEIKALIGGLDFNESKFNRALMARRQIGSILKPLIYAAALDQGYDFTHTEIDEPFTLEQGQNIWSPRNYNHKFDGEITLAHALSYSNNIVAIKMLLTVGAEHIVKLAQNSGITAPMHTYPSLALGCIDTTLLEVAGLFNVFAHSGVYVEPHFITWIKDSLDNKIFKHQNHEHRVLASRTNDQVAQVLTHSLARLRHRHKEWLTCAAISKTGTTNDSRSCWYAGSTPQFTTAVYIGCDDNRSMGNNIFPSRTAFPIWLAVNRVLPCTQKEFTFDPSLQETYIDQFTGAPACAGERHAVPILR
jgi:penicillin-binding protein 1A